MDGRLAHDLKRQKANKNKLSKMPRFATEYYNFLKASRNTEATCKDYLNKVNHYLEFINSNTSEITGEDITADNVIDYLNSLETKRINNGGEAYTSDSYKQCVWICLNGFMNFMVSRGYINHNYVADIAKPRINDQDRVNRKRVLLTTEDFIKILKATDNNNSYVAGIRDRAILSLMMSTGMRESALTEINIDNLDLETKAIHGIAKGKKEMGYNFSDSTCLALKAWVEVRDNYITGTEEDSLFLSRDGNRMSVNTVAKLIKKYTKQALGKPLSPHKLRAGYVSIIMEKTGNIEFARRAVGHASTRTTQLYVVTNGNEKQEAADLIGI